MPNILTRLPVHLVALVLVIGLAGCDSPEREQQSASPPPAALDIIQTLDFDVSLADTRVTLTADRNHVWIDTGSQIHQIRPRRGDAPIERVRASVVDLDLGQSRDNRRLALSDFGITDRHVLWLLSNDNNRRTMIHRSELRQTRDDRLEVDASDLVVAFDTAWFFDGSTDAVVRMDPDRARVAERIPVRSHNARVLTADGSAIWVADNAHGSLIRIDPDDSTTEVIPDVPHVSSLVSAAGRVWAQSLYPPSTLRIDPTTRAVSRLPMASDLVTDGKTVWGTSRQWLYSFGSDADVGRRTNIPSGYQLMLAAFDSLWFIDSDTGNVVRTAIPDPGEPVSYDDALFDRAVPRRLADGKKAPSTPAELKDVVEEPVVMAQRVTAPPGLVAACAAKKNFDPQGEVYAYLSPDGLSSASRKVSTVGPPDAPAQACDGQRKRGTWETCEYGSFGRLNDTPEWGWEPAHCDSPPRTVIFCTFEVPDRATWTLQWRLAYWVAYPVRGAPVVRVAALRDRSSFPDTYLVDVDGTGRRIGSRAASCG